MLRRQIRLRKEYLYRKSIEDNERTIAEKKETIKKSLDENQVIPTHLRDEALQLQKALDWDDGGGEGNTTHVDDEYRWAGVEDPKIMITSSRKPSSRLKMFVKEMSLMFPNAQRMNRGNYETKQLVEACRANGVTDFIIIHEHSGNPTGLIICHLPYGPTAYFTLSNVVMRHDIPDVGTMSEAYPHLIFHNFKTKLGKRVMNILKYLFPVPKEDSKRVITFANQEDYILFRHHVYKKGENPKDVELVEVGPRFQIKLYLIKLGTFEQGNAADIEWVLKPYTNTARKKLFLSEDDAFDDKSTP